jgi:RNA polymerase sigma-70 factor (ECF subfamily)
MASENAIHQAMLAAIPHLRAFAVALTGNLERADDLVQSALMRGLENLDKFQPGTSMQAWLFTIMRNHYYTELRKHRREVEDPDGAMAQQVAVMPEQGSRLDFTDMQAALARLSPEQREALLLVSAEGVSYEEAAQICGRNIGTIKSRVNRARTRTRLAELLALDAEEELGPDRLVKATLFLHTPWEGRQCTRQARGSDHLFGHALVGDLAGGGGAGFDCGNGRSVLHRRVEALLSLLGKLPLRCEPVVLGIAGAALTLPDLVSPLSDLLILAGGDGCGRQCVRHDRLPMPGLPDQCTVKN